MPAPHRTTRGERGKQKEDAVKLVVHIRVWVVGGQSGGGGGNQIYPIFYLCQGDYSFSYLLV